MSMFSNLAKRYSDGNLIVQIIIGLVLGTILGYAANKSGADSIKSFALSISVLGDLFVGALKAIAPILVFVLVTTSIVVKEFGESKGLKKVILLYVIGTLSASFIAVAASFLFPVELSLKGIEAVDKPAAQEISAVLKTLLFKLVDNPVSALANANYLGILTWSIAAGLALRNSAKEVKTIFSSFADGITKVVKFIIRLAPFGIFGLVTFSVYDTGFDALLGYAKLLGVLVGVMLVIAFIVNPIIVFFIIGKNPYPLVLTCVKESGITAFFTRSSAANIPVNLNLCKKLNLNEGLYSVSIPLGASINMAGAAVTISVLALAAVNSIESVQVSFMNAFLLSIISAVAACGASGVAGGSLMLVPLACSLFGISNDIALQVVAVGFIIGVIQDSVETALNSSSDVLFTATASMSHKE